VPLDKVNAMIRYKERKASENRDAVLTALQNLDKPVSIAEITNYLNEKARNKAQLDAEILYNDGGLTAGERDEYIAKKGLSMNKRTTRRILYEFISQDLVIKEGTNFFLSNMGKRELQFRDFASGYGKLALAMLMNSHFPTISTLEENLTRLVEIFGIYVVYCLLEAVRLITDSNQEYIYRHSYYFRDSSNFNSEGKFKEAKIASSWIKDVFNPMEMLNLFLTAIQNSSNKNGTKFVKKRENNDKQKTALQQYSRYYGEVNIAPLMKPGDINKMQEKNNHVSKVIRHPSPTTLDLIFQRSWNSVGLHISPNVNSGNNKTIESLMNDRINQYMKFKIDYSNHSKPLYELDNKKMSRLKMILEKKYPLFCNSLQKTDRYFCSDEPF
jgi:hypothetical protein